MVGPDDHLVVHTDADARAHDENEGSKGGNGLASSVLMPPRVSVAVQYLVVTGGVPISSKR